MFPIYFDPVCEICEDDISDEDPDTECVDLFEIEPAFTVPKTPIDVVSVSPQENRVVPYVPPVPASCVTSIASSRSSSNTLRDIDLNIIRTRLDVEFSYAPEIDERALVTLNGKVNMGKKERKPYESAIRLKTVEVCIPIKERRLSKADLALVETLKCKCKSHCCLKFSSSDILELREHTYSMNKKRSKRIYYSRPFKTWYKNRRDVYLQVLFKAKRGTLPLKKVSLANDKLFTVD